MGAAGCLGNQKKPQRKNAAAQQNNPAQPVQVQQAPLQVSTHNNEIDQEKRQKEEQEQKQKEERQRIQRLERQKQAERIRVRNSVQKQFNRYEDEENDYDELGKKKVEIGIGPTQKIF